MNNIKLSIIVPVYNVEKYIENTLASICAQTYSDLEIIVVDDGSKDDSLHIVEKQAEKDSRIHVIHKENGGVTSARLCGIKAATGEWIGFVDGDDYIEPQMYEMLINHAIKYQADISHCGYQMVFPNRIDFYYGTGKLVHQDKLTGIRDLLQGKFVEPGLCNKLYRRSLFQELINKEKMDLSIKNTEDLLMNYYLFNEAVKSVFSDECPYHYLVRKGSASTSTINENKLRDPLKVLKILEEETKDEEGLNYIVKRRIVAQLIYLATINSKSQKELILPYRKQARKELRRMLPTVLKGAYSKKQKVMTGMVAVSPGLYGFIHRIYAKATGLDKKYEVN